MFYKRVLFAIIGIWKNCPILRCDFYFQFAEESSTRVEFTSAGSIGPSFFASLHDILHRPLIAWPVQKERKYGSK